MSYVLFVDSSLGIDSDRIKTRNKRLLSSYLKGGSKPLFSSHKEVKDIVNQYDIKAIVCFGEDALRALFSNLPNTVKVMYKAQFTEFLLHTKKRSIPTFISPSLKYIKNQRNSEEYTSALRHLIITASNSSVVKLDLNYNHKTIKTKSELRDFFARLKQEKIVAFDIETVGLTPFSKGLQKPALYSIAFAFSDGDTFSFPIETSWDKNTQKSIKKALAKWLIELAPEQVRIAHNLKFEMTWLLERCIPELDLHWRNVREVGVYEDTMLLGWLLNGNKGVNSLKFMAPVYLGVGAWDIDVTDVRTQPLDKVLNYNALDAFYTLKLWERVKEKVNKESELLKTYNRILMPVCLEFVRVEMRGVPYDKKIADKFTDKFNKIKVNCMKTIINQVGFALSPSENDSLIDYFQKKGYKWDGITDKGAISMGEEQLNQIAKKYKEESLCNAIIGFRKATKALSTYIESPQQFLYTDNTIKSSYNLTSTITGRTSSNSPNMQNFPKRKGKEVRECFVAPEGYVFASFDYGQIEARLFGVLTGDPTFVKDLFDGVDMHLENAKKVFGESQGKEMRNSMKGGTFGALYGSSITNLKNVLNITYEKAQKLVNFIFKKYPKFKTWQKLLFKFKELKGYVEGLTGRRRREPVTYNESLNHPLQSSASDLCLISLIYLSRKYELIMMIHDDLTFLLKKETLEEDIEKIVEGMLVLPWLVIYDSPHNKAWCPLQVEVEVGENWGNQEFVMQMDAIELGIDNQEKCIKRAKEVAEYFMKY